MSPVLKLLVAVVIVGSVVAPLVTVAAGFPFRLLGGKIISAIPCDQGFIQITVVGPRQGRFVWTPATLTYLYGPPKPGANILGFALPGTPAVCTVGGHPIPGDPILTEGTSLSI
jgi:hypothetical protein